MALEQINITEGGTGTSESPIVEDKTNNGSFLERSLNEINNTANLANSLLTGLRGGGSTGGQILYFPSQLLENNKWPYTRFSILGGQTSIHLPMPPDGIAFNDGADYSTIDLGIIGSSMFGIFNKDQETPNVALTGKSITGGALAGMSIMAKSLGADKISNVIDYANQRVIAKNTATNFQSNTIRSFSFNFKMIAKSQQEAMQIKKIITTFRENVYGILDQSGMTIEYPKPWRIQFFFEGSENKYIPFIKYSYLKSLTSNYSQTTNLLHYDGAPVEVNITLEFQETKVLHRQDVQLEGQNYANDNAIDAARDVVDRFANYLDEKLTNKEAASEEIQNTPNPPTD